VRPVRVGKRVRNHKVRRLGLGVESEKPSAPPPYNPKIPLPQRFGK